MFANTGIVHAVLPARITDIGTVGVFYNCKQMETVTFEADTLKTRSIGAMFFYGCSKLKEVEVPAGASSPLVSTLKNADGAIFAGCTALEKVVIHITGSSGQDTGLSTFAGCSSLKSVQILKPDGTEVGFRYLNDGAFYGCSSLKNITLYLAEVSIKGNPFEGSGFEIMKLDTVRYFLNGTNFAGMPNLKELWIGYRSLSLTEETFKNLSCDVNIYFYNHTYEQVVNLCGDAWFKNASEKAHFYFKDTIPEGVVPPEGVVLPEKTTG